MHFLLGLASALYVTCSGQAPDPAYEDLVVEAQGTFHADLPAGFEICRHPFTIDDINFNVRRDGVNYLTVWVGMFPYGGPSNERQRIETADPAERIVRPPDGRSESTVIRIGDADIVRETLHFTTKRGAMGNPLYVVVRIDDDLPTSQYAEAAKIAETIRPR